MATKTKMVNKALSELNLRQNIERCKRDPMFFAEEVIGVDKLKAYQLEVMEKVINPPMFLNEDWFPPIYPRVDIDRYKTKVERYGFSPALGALRLQKTFYEETIAEVSEHVEARKVKKMKKDELIKENERLRGVVKERDEAIEDAQANDAVVRRKFGDVLNMPGRNYLSMSCNTPTWEGIFFAVGGFYATSKSAELEKENQQLKANIHDLENDDE